MEGPAADRRPRILILSADVGEGHVAAGRALAERLAAQPATVSERDGLAAFGPVVRHVIRDGYRFQLRWLASSYNLSHWTFAHVPAARAAGARALTRSGGRRLRRLVVAERADVVVSTHPALTAVLGRLRVRRRLGAILCATVTDLADFAFWSSPGADLHLVMHPAVVADVEREAGVGSAIAVAPLVSPRFLGRCDRAAARNALGLPVDGSLVVVSGGGWGVGDLAGGAEAALAAGAAGVVVLAGRNAPALATLRQRFRADGRVRVWGFTDRMPELLGAADVIVHSTGGVTTLEALACGCPLIAYGSTLGHVRIHNARMAELGLLEVAADADALRALLAARLAAAPATTLHELPGPEPGAVVAGVTARVRPLSRWRLAADRALAGVACAGVLLWSLATDDAYTFASAPLRMAPVSHLSTPTLDVALVVRVPAGAAPALATALARDGVHATFASLDEPSAAGRRTIASAGDDVLPALGAAAPARWLRTRAHLADAPSAAGRRRYLVPPGGLTLGQYVMARSAGAAPLRGQEDVDLASGGDGPAARPGDIVIAAGAPSPATVVRLAGRLRERGLSPVPLSTLAGDSSTTERTTGDVTSATAAPTTTSRAITRPATPATP